MLNFKQWMEVDYYGGQKQSGAFATLKSIASSHSNPDNLVVTFTAVNKVGINPKNYHTTPLGIYLYPISYVIEREMRVPYAAEQPYVSVCEFTNPSKILHMKVIPGLSGIPDSNEALKATQKGLEFIDPDVLKETITRFRYHVKSDYSLLWSSGWVASGGLSGRSGNKTRWNGYYRERGIDGFFDHGTGTIYELEPFQVVVFHKNALKVIHTIERHRWLPKPEKPQPVAKPVVATPSPKLPPEATKWLKSKPLI